MSAYLDALLAALRPASRDGRGASPTRPYTLEDNKAYSKQGIKFSTDAMADLPTLLLGGGSGKDLSPGILMGMAGLPGKMSGKSKEATDLAIRAKIGEPGTKDALLEQLAPFFRFLTRQHRVDPIAKGVSRTQAPRPSTTDAQQIAAETTLNALPSFDWTKGKSFPSYIAPSIRRDVIRGVRDAAEPVAMPREDRELWSKITRIADAYTKTTGQKPSDNFIAKRLVGEAHPGMPMKDRTKLIEAMEAKLENLYANRGSRVSWSAGVGKEGDAKRQLQTVIDPKQIQEAGSDTVTSPDIHRLSQRPDSMSEGNEQWSKAMEAIEGMKDKDPKRYEILMNEFAPEGERLTQKQMAERFGVNQQRVAAMRKQALDRIMKIVKPPEIKGGSDAADPYGKVLRDSIDKQLDIPGLKQERDYLKRVDAGIPASEPKQGVMQRSPYAKARELQDQTDSLTKYVEFLKQHLQRIEATEGRVRNSGAGRTSPRPMPPISGGAGKPAPVVFRGKQDDMKGGSFDLWNLTEDIAGHPKGSTVSTDTLRKLGYDVPAKPMSGGAPGPDDAFRRIIGDTNAAYGGTNIPGRKLIQGGIDDIVKHEEGNWMFDATRQADMPSYPLPGRASKRFLEPRTDIQMGVDKSSLGPWTRTGPKDDPSFFKLYGKDLPIDDEGPYRHRLSNDIGGSELIKDILWGAIRRAPRQEP